jgi:hypothetical protein
MSRSRRGRDSLPAAFAVVRYLAMVLCCRIEPEVWIPCEPDRGVPFYPVAMLIVLIRGMRSRIQLVLLIRQEFNLPSARVKFPHALYAVNYLFDKVASAVVLPFFVVGITLRSDCTSIVKIGTTARGSIALSIILFGWDAIPRSCCGHWETLAQQLRSLHRTPGSPLQ